MSDQHISPWPILVSLSSALAGASYFGFIASESKIGLISSVFFACIFLWAIVMWGRDVIRDFTSGAVDPDWASKCLLYGILIFIASESLIFLTCFASLFNFSHLMTHILGDGWDLIKVSWPPKNLSLVDKWDIPWVNTLILLLSGTAATRAHHASHTGKCSIVRSGIKYSIYLGVAFLMLQIYEYHHIQFSLGQNNIGNIFSSLFFVTTGLHGLHVAAGVVFFVIEYFRIKNTDVSNHHSTQLQVGLEASIWYWHFVDVVWIIVFICVYP